MAKTIAHQAAAQHLVHQAAAQHLAHRAATQLHADQAVLQAVDHAHQLHLAHLVAQFTHLAASLSVHQHLSAQLRDVLLHVANKV